MCESHEFPTTINRRMMKSNYRDMENVSLYCEKLVSGSHLGTVIPIFPTAVLLKQEKKRLFYRTSKTHVILSSVKLVICSHTGILEQFYPPVPFVKSLYEN